MTAISVNPPAGFMTRLGLGRPRPAPMPMPAEVPSPAIVPAPSQAIFPVATARQDSTTRVLLVEALTEVSQRVADLLRADEDVQLIETVSDGQLAMDRIRETRPDVVILDVLLQGKANGLEIARHIRASGLSTPIVLLTVPEMPVRLNADMGIADVQLLPLEGNALRGTIVRLDEAHRGPAPVTRSRTIVVYSGKGGVGRTTVAYELARTLSKHPGVRVALVDGDPVHGDLRLHLDAPDNAPSLVQRPTGHVKPDELAEVMWQDPSGIDVLLAPPLMEQADLIVQRDIATALALLREAYDVVVVDAPARMDDTTLAMLDGADAIIEVVVPERGAIRKAQRYHRVLTAADFPTDKIATVLNRADSAGPSAAEVSAALGRQFEAVLPNDPVVDRQDQGFAAGSPDPSAPVSGSFEHLAGVVIEKVTGAGTGSIAAAA